MHPTREQAIELLREIAKLLKLKGENPFKIRAFERAQDTLLDHDDLAERAGEGKLEELPGIGKGIAEVLKEFFLTGKSKARDELAASLPEGLVELTSIPGVGPKRAQSLIDQLGVRSIRELEYACRENHLLHLKGFGKKAQEEILRQIERINAHRARLRLVDAEPLAELFLEALKKAAGPGLRVTETGELRRKCEVLGKFEFLIEQSPKPDGNFQEKLKKATDRLIQKTGTSLPVLFHFAKKKEFGTALLQTTGAAAHVKGIQKLSKEPLKAFSEEEDAYHALKIEWISPELRETGEEIELEKKGKLSSIVGWNSIQGVFHNHTTRSDGTASLEQMVVRAKELGLKYIGISDHSQSSFYAQGLKKEEIKEQEKEIRRVREKYPEIRVFWGIESDILRDGSLDYEDRVLRKFDFVIASIHQRFALGEREMTERILKAVRHPCTRFIGHITGRLLLGREAYALDMEKIIEEAARCDVAIELNSNPARLDIDWRWGPVLRKFKTSVSINPDAHSTAGLEDTRFGVIMARKALLPGSQVVNTRSVSEIEKWLRRA